MTLHVNDGGVWKSANPHVNDGGVWKACKDVWVNDGGAWKQVYVAFSPVPGTYSDDNNGSGTVSFTINSLGGPVTWNWSQTQLIGSGGGSGSIVSGSSASSITFQVAEGASTRQVRFDVTVGSNTWTITLTATTGGGGVGATVTL